MRDFTNKYGPTVFGNGSVYFLLVNRNWQMIKHIEKFHFLAIAASLLAADYPFVLIRC